MAFMGADTDALREAGEECQEGKEKTDQVIQYLRMLIMALRAASFFTGGASLAYAEYLEGTVVPWLERISQALGMMAKVLMDNAQEQDDVSNSGSEISSPRTLSYSTPGGSMPSQSIGVWEGTIVPSVAPVAGDTGSAGSFGATPGTSTPVGIGSVPGAGGTGAMPSSGSGSYGTTGIDAPAATSGIGTGSWATNDHVGQATASMGLSAPGSALGGSTIGGGSPAGGSGGMGAGSFGSGGGGTAGSSGIGSPSIGGGSPLGSPDGSGTGLSSYSNGNLASGIGGGTPDNGAGGSLGAPTTDGTAREGGGSYAAVAGVAGTAGALGLGGAAMAARSGAATDKRIDELSATNHNGSRGESVKELQQRLTAAGYDTKGADGAWGRNTQAAYDAYRQDHPLEVRPGKGYVSPDGFDYTRITHVQGNPHVTPEFLRGVEGIAQRLGTKPEHLLTAMAFESRLDPRADNPNSSAYGLIQFMKETRKGLGVTQEQLSRMTATEQLPYVEKYFAGRKNQLGSLEAVYTTILAGRPASGDDVLFERGSRSYRANSGLDINHDGRLTAAEATAVVRRKLRN